MQVSEKVRKKSGEEKMYPSRKSKRVVKKVDMSKINKRFYNYPGPFRKTKFLKECFNPNEFEKVFRDKIDNCCIPMDFSNPRTYDERDSKQKALIDVLEHISLHSGPFPDFWYSCIVQLVGCNAFRSLAPFHPILLLGIEEEEEYQLCDNWPHLQFVYEIFLKFMEHSQFSAQKAKSNIDNMFVACLLNIFDSADPRERDYLKTSLHRIYGKMINLRSFIRKQINNVFYTFLYETNRHNGIAELLEILGSIINGFQIPLKEEHKVFLKHVLLPLHKPQQLTNYHPQLAYCVMEFIKKENTLVKVVLMHGLLKYWPKSNSFKELLFLNELEECIELCKPEFFSDIISPLFKQIAACVSSQNFQIVERTLYLWTNAEVVDLMRHNIIQILPIVFPALYNAKQHWNKVIHPMVFNALKVMMDLDPVNFDDYTSKFKDERHKEKEKIKYQKDNWRTIKSKAKKNPLSKRFSDSMSSTYDSYVEHKDIDKNIKQITQEIKQHNVEDTIMKKMQTPRTTSSLIGKDQAPLSHKSNLP